jgi:4-hydroxymandelate oxidase
MRMPAEPRHPWADDLERAAADLVGPDVFGFIAGGAGSERTVAGNRAAFDRYQLLPRVLVDVGTVSLASELLGVPLAAPLLLAPMGTHELVHPDAEVASTTVARELGLGVIVSTAASRTLEELAEVEPRPRWFQLYMFRDRGVVADLVDRATAAGYDALCVTVDTPVLGDRRTDRRTRFTPDPSIRWSNLGAYAASALPSVTDGTAVARFIADQLDPGLTWDDLSWLQQRSNLPITLKGVLDPRDAARAVEVGVDAVVVSNHGGRQLDRCIASLDALPSVVEAVDDRVPVVLDGGVRDAPDVAIALALGAAAVTIGRPVLWALACGGEDLVRSYLQDLVVDLERTLRILGRRGLRELGRDAVVPAAARERGP